MFSWFGYPLPFEERLQLIKEAGFCASSFWLGEEEELVRTGKLDAMPALIRSQGLFLEYAHAPDAGCNDLWSESRYQRQKIKEIYHRYIAVCQKHRIPILAFHVSQSKGEQPVAPTEEGLKVVEELVKFAEDCDVKIAVENTMAPTFLDFVLSQIESPHLGFCYDTSHDFLYSPEPGLLIERWGKRLLMTHLADNDGVLDRHWLPGAGIIDWEVVRSRFPSETYRGFYNLEVFPKDPLLKEGASQFVSAGYHSIEWLVGVLQSM
jgi:sugar phosphate isomerase/epimerase